MTSRLAALARGRVFEKEKVNEAVNELTASRYTSRDLHEIIIEEDFTRLDEMLEYGNSFYFDTVDLSKNGRERVVSNMEAYAERLRERGYQVTKLVSPAPNPISPLEYTGVVKELTYGLLVRGKAEIIHMEIK